MRKSTVYLTEEAERRMRQAASRLGRSQAELTRQAIDEYLDRAERQFEPPPSFGSADNRDVDSSTYEDVLAERWGRR